MSASARDLERAAQVQFLGVQKAKQKTGDIQHALNLVFNFVFESFHIALTVDGPVYDFELGTVKNFLWATQNPEVISTFSTSSRM